MGEGGEEVCTKRVHANKNWSRLKSEGGGGERIMSEEKNETRTQLYEHKYVFVVARLLLLYVKCVRSTKFS